MPVIVSCKCGKKFKAKDEMAGKTISCPGCGGALRIPSAAPAAMAVAAAPAPRAAPIAAPAPASRPAAMPMYPGLRRPSARPEERASRFSMSPKAIVFTVLAVLLPVLILAAKFGPMAAWQEWSAKEGQIRADINDSIEIWMRNQMPTPPPGVIIHQRNLPTLDTLILDEPIMPLTFPSTIDFQGKSSMGDVRGVYHTKTRRTVATVGSKKVSAKATEKGPEFEQ